MLEVKNVGQEFVYYFEVEKGKVVDGKEKLGMIKILADIVADQIIRDSN